MTADVFAAELAAAADEALWRTNPAWCVGRLVKRWERQEAYAVHLPIWLGRLLGALPGHNLRLPRVALDRWRSQYGLPPESDDSIEPPNPGVVGLIVDVVSHDALVVPLSAERCGEWSVEPTLPFRPATTLQDLLHRLLHPLGLPHLDGVPERFAFALRDPLGRRSDGPSMHVAGLLAVIREANDRPREFDRACAVVQPAGEQLVPVGGVRPKLDAFLRECGTGTLLVRCRGDGEAGAYDPHFHTVWLVDSLAELARELEARRWLEVFLANQPLNAADAGTVSGRVRRLEGAEHRYADALDLSTRAERCGYGPDVSNRIRREFRQNVIDLYRHLGAYARSAELAEREHRLSQSTRASSYDDQAQADLTYAAALYAPHRFDETHLLLDPWREKLTADPLLVTPLTRVKVFNTLGRAWVALGRGRWEDLFRRSEELLEELDPADLPRTWCYLAHGLLRAGRLREAEDVLRRIEAHPGVGEMSRWFLRILQADAARRRGETWTDSEMERAAVSRRVGHPFGFYLQATARQPGRGPGDAIDRFRRAREFLGQDEPDGDDRNIQRFLAGCLCLAEAAWAADRGLWDEARAAIERHLSPIPGLALHGYYAGCLPEPGSVPDRAAAERLLSRVPFF
jgi:pentatricopeptide repeat protein